MIRKKKFGHAQSIMPAVVTSNRLETHWLGSESALDLIDDVLLNILCLCDIVTITVISQVLCTDALYKYTYINKCVTARLASVCTLSRSPGKFGLRSCLASKLEISSISDHMKLYKNFHFRRSLIWSRAQSMDLLLG